MASSAQNQSAKSWELRAVTSLAKLWLSQGKRQEAYDLLAPVYSWLKLRDMAKAEGLTIRFKDKVRRRRDKETKQFVGRHNFEFLVSKPTPKQEEGTSKLQKGRK